MADNFAQIIGLNRPVRKRGKAAADQAPCLRRDELVIGGHYTRRQIHEALGGGIQEYLPHKDGKVVCGCFTRETSPCAPQVVLSGPGPRIRYWAEVYARQGDAVPVFIKMATANWEYMGDYSVRAMITDPRSAEKIGRQQGRDGIRVVLVLRTQNEAAVSASVSYIPQAP
jgi:hypothetical protein